ncbi:hypothetical protein PFISCL1PPCAC_4128, partial [Pristionchus fissidentatus]
RLPKIQIQQFNGDITQWYHFWESFETLIHNTHISDVLKFTYLRSFLCEEARLVISGINLTELNYSIAIQSLHDRYGNAKIIATKLRQELLNLPTCEKQKPDNFEFGFLIEQKLPREVISEIYSDRKGDISAKELLFRLQNIVERTILVDEIVDSRT